jgi:hypothetical protein
MISGFTVPIVIPLCCDSQLRLNFISDCYVRNDIEMSFHAYVITNNGSVDEPMEKAI